LKSSEIIILAPTWHIFKIADSLIPNTRLLVVIFQTSNLLEPLDMYLLETVGRNNSLIPPTRALYMPK
jgi:hypothetical protein